MSRATFHRLEELTKTLRCRIPLERGNSLDKHLQLEHFVDRHLAHFNELLGEMLGPWQVDGNVDQGWLAYKDGTQSL